MYKFGANDFFRGCETLRLDLLELFGTYYVIEHFYSDLKDRREKELPWLYANMALYALTNHGKMEKSYAEILSMVNKPKEPRSGKEVAEAAAKRMGTKINWNK